MDWETHYFSPGRTWGHTFFLEAVKTYALGIGEPATLTHPLLPLLSEDAEEAIQLGSLTLGTVI